MTGDDFNPINGPTNRSISGSPRRQLLRAGGMLAVGATVGSLGIPSAAVAATSAGRATDRPTGRLPLARTRAAGIHVAQVDLAVRSHGAWTSERLSTDDFALLGFSWPAHAPDPSISVRVRSGGTWDAWRALPILDDRPDPDDRASLRHATQPLWVGHADGVQARVEGHRPKTVTLSLIRPDVERRDAAVAGRLSPTLGRTVPSTGEQGAVAAPQILLRADWSANESWRDGRASYNSTIQQMHVHHTVSGNTYSRSETPGLLRGMYYYHTHTLGWSDIGYNFLVDRFGRIWEGRAGGIDKAVRGAHTLGFNATSCGVSVIGNLEETRPSEETIAAIAQVAAWKLSLYGRDPLGTTSVVSEGSDKFSRDRTVMLPVIDGHRDTNDTACPGRYLYERLGDIRRGTRELMDASTPAPQPPPTQPAPSEVAITRAYAVSGDPSPGSTLLVSGGAFTPAGATASYAWLRDGVKIRGADRPRRVLKAADAGHVVSAVVTLRAEGSDPAFQRIDVPEAVRYPSTLALTLRTRHRHLLVATVAVNPSVAGVEATGTVDIRVDGDTQTVRVVGGRASATFRRRAGNHPVRVDYSGSSLVRPASAETSFTTTPPTTKR